ncbi:hypothetical protein [Sphingomonas sp.]|uniref:hypothetical protein n=1 Tax=Sphingomonas sp. TaxID=28214 RepID=UPI0035BC51AE
MRSTVAFSALIVLGTPVAGQTRTAADTVTAYGTRLNAETQPSGINTRRVNNRIAGRIDGRLGLRIERYRLESATDPTAAYRVTRTDNSREARSEVTARTIPAPSPYADRLADTDGRERSPSMSPR